MPQGTNDQILLKPWLLPRAFSNREGLTPVCLVEGNRVWPRLRILTDEMGFSRLPLDPGFQMKAVLKTEFCFPIVPDEPDFP